MNNSSVTIAVSQIMAFPSHPFTRGHEGEDQPQGCQAKDKHCRQPNRQVHDQSFESDMSFRCNWSAANWKISKSLGMTKLG